MNNESWRALGHCLSLKPDADICHCSLSLMAARCLLAVFTAAAFGIGIGNGIGIDSNADTGTVAATAAATEPSSSALWAAAACRQCRPERR